MHSENREDHQYKAKDQLAFQRHNHHQPGVKEYRHQDTGIQESEGVAHF